MENKVTVGDVGGTTEEMTIDLFEYFWFLVKKWKVIMGSVITCFLIAFIYLFGIATPIYESTAQIYVVNSSGSVMNLSDLQIGTYLASDYQLVFNTWEVNQEVIMNLNLPYTVDELLGMLTITNPSSTRALFITVASPDAKEAADIANEYAAVAKRYIADTMQADEPTTMSMALESLDPVWPRRLMSLMIACFVGLLLPIVILFVMFVRDDKIKTSADVQKYTGAAPLAVIPVTDKHYTDRSWRNRR